MSWMSAARQKFGSYLCLCVTVLLLNVFYWFYSGESSFNNALTFLHKAKEIILFSGLEIADVWYEDPIWRFSLQFDHLGITNYMHQFRRPDLKPNLNDIMVVVSVIYLTSLSRVQRASAKSTSNMYYFVLNWGGKNTKFDPDY